MTRHTSITATYTSTFNSELKKFEVVSDLLTMRERVGVPEE